MVVVIVWQMQCDANHRWSVPMPDGGELAAEAMQCQCGLEAVTARKEVSADRVHFTVRSCARVADRVTGDVVDDGVVMLAIADSDGRTREVGPMPISKSFDWMSELSRCSSADVWRKLERMLPLPDS